MRSFTKTAMILLMMVSGLTATFGQAGTIEPQAITESTSSVTLKTIRALFPEQPVAVANELFGGLHSVENISILSGGSQTILNDSMLQIGMMVYVSEVNMYFRYKGKFGGVYNTAETGANKGLYGENTDHWESLADVIMPAVADSVFINKDTALIIDAFVGDILIDTAGVDTTWAYSGTKWNVIAIDQANTISYTDTTTAIGIHAGDMTINGDTTFAYDGKKWTIISIIDTVSTPEYPVYITLDDGASQLTQWGVDAVDQDAFRSALPGLATGNKLTGSDGVSIYYPAAWGDFTYSIEVVGQKIELTNGVSTQVDTYLISSGSADPTGTLINYKKVRISSQTKTVLVD